MALPILAKGITSALTKKGKDAKKDDKVSAQKLLSNSTTSPAKSRAQFSKVEPRKLTPYRKKVETTKFLPPSKVDEKSSINKLDALLTSLVGSTANLQKITKKDLGDVKKDNRTKENIKQKSKRERNEEKTESKKTVAKVSKPMKLTVPSLFKDIFKMGGRLILSLGIMELLKFLDPEKKESIFGFLTEHLDKIILGTLGILGIAFVASFLPVISMVGTILSIVSPVILAIGGILLNPIVLGAVGIVLGAITLRQWLYENFKPQAEKFYNEKVKKFVDEANYGDRADEGGFITKLRDNYGRISKKEDRAKLTDKEKTTQQFLRIYDEKLKELKRAKDNAKPGAFKGSGGSEEVKRLKDELEQMAEQLKIGGKTLAELQAEFEKDGSLPQTSITKSQTQSSEAPKVTPDTVDPDTETGDGSIEIRGDGSGGGGTLTFKKGGKVVGSQYKAYSGVRSTWGSSQEQRKNRSGNNDPMPDGNYPLLGFNEHGPWPGLPGIGDWSAFINPGGSIGARGGIMLHNDIGSNGTAGCIGVELGGTVGTAAEKKFLGLYKKVNPKKIKVSLASGGGGASSTENRPTTPDTKISSTKSTTGIDKKASYEETGTQVAMIQVPLPVPMPLPGGGGGTSSGGSRGSGGYDIDSIILGQSFSNA